MPRTPPPLASGLGFYKYSTNMRLFLIKIMFLYIVGAPHMHHWCSGNMEPFQGSASGSIPE